ncbi:MAG: CHAD domain-containing protein [Burkholderiales bacterium]
MPAEIELKLAINPRQVSRLLRHPLLKSPGAKTTTLKSVYYDTVKFDLRERGFALRLRRIGRRTVQTLKAEGKVEGGLHERPEWEAETRAGQLNSQALKVTPLAECCALDEIALKPVFVTEFKRAHRVLESPEHVVEFALDQGEIRANGVSVAISEIELELVSGAPTQLFELALQFNKAAPLRIANQSKADRGYALAAGASRKPVKARPLKLTPNMTVSDALKAIAFDCIAHFEANVAERHADPEYVHQMRVALRRLRSALTLFGMIIPKGALASHRNEIRWLARELGAARDWDVFTVSTLPAILAQFPDHAGLHALLRRAQKARRSANAQAQKAVSSQRTAEFFLRLCAWLATDAWMSMATESMRQALSFPIAGFAGAVLAKRHKHVLKVSPAALDAEARHRLRIALKKLRYAAEFFAPLFTKRRVQKYISGLMALQDVLGELNDGAVTGGLLDSLPDEPEAVGMARAFTAARVQTKTGELDQAWENWLRVKTFW